MNEDAEHTDDQDLTLESTREEVRDWLVNPDRQRSILTRGDRRFLLGEGKESEQAERTTRYRIKKRVASGIRDISFLAATNQHGVETAALNTLEIDGLTKLRLAQGLLDMGFAAVVGLSLDDQLDDLQFGGEEQLVGTMERMTQGALNHVIKQKTTDQNPTSSVEIELGLTPEEDMFSRFIHGQVTHEEVKDMIASGYAPEVKELLEEHDEEIRVYHPDLSAYSSISPEDLPQMEQ